MTTGVHRATTGDGIDVAVHVFGGDGPPLLMAHATGFHGRVFEPLAELLSGSFSCVSADLRAHGDSSAPPEADLDWYGFASDLLAVVDALELARPLGFGHSSGATGLLLAEAERPGTFSSLYCFEPVIVPADPPLGRDRENWLAEGARRRRASFASRAEALDHYAARPTLSGFAPEVLRAYVEHGFADGRGEVRLKCMPEHEALVYEMATAHDCYRRLEEVKCPVVVARGERSESLMPRVAEQVAARLPRARVEVLPGLTHFGPLENPAAVAASLRAAFGRGPP